MNDGRFGRFTFPATPDAALVPRDPRAAYEIFAARTPTRLFPCLVVFGPTPFVQGQTLELTSTTDTVFRPERLVVDPLCAPYYWISSIQNHKWMILQHPLAATLFPPLPPNFDTLSDADQKAIRDHLDKLPFETLQPNSRLTLVVQHRGKCPHPDCVALGQSCLVPPFSAYVQGKGMA